MSWDRSVRKSHNYNKNAMGVGGQANDNYRDAYTHTRHANEPHVQRRATWLKLSSRDLKQLARVSTAVPFPARCGRCGWRPLLLPLLRQSACTLPRSRTLSRAWWARVAACAICMGFTCEAGALQLSTSGRVKALAMIGLPATCTLYGSLSIRARIATNYTKICACQRSSALFGNGGTTWRTASESTSCGVCHIRLKTRPLLPPMQL